MIPLAQIAEPPAPLRAAMDEKALAELAGDIRLRGILQPLVVVPIPQPESLAGRDGAPGDDRANGGQSPRFEIVAGHRRYLAARMACIESAPCMIHERNAEFIAAAKLAENIMREDVTAAEEGWFFLELVEQHGWTEEALCQKLGKSSDYIAERINLVRNDGEVAGAVAERKVVYSVARELLRVNDHTCALILKVPVTEVSAEQTRKNIEHRHYLLRLAIEAGANARSVRSWVEQWKQNFVPAGTPGPASTGPDGVVIPPASPYTCVVCGASHDPYNMLPVYVHKWELMLFKKACGEAKEAAGCA
jgi:ParB/RepB/Spo0J family partition protein